MRLTAYKKRPFFAALLLLWTLTAADGWAQEKTLSAQGLIVPFRQVKLSSPVEAIVRKIQVKEGDRVEYKTQAAQ